MPAGAANPWRKNCPGCGRSPMLGDTECRYCGEALPPSRRRSSAVAWALFLLAFGAASAMLAMRGPDAGALFSPHTPNAISIYRGSSLSIGVAALLGAMLGGAFPAASALVLAMMLMPVSSETIALLGGYAATLWPRPLFSQEPEDYDLPDGDPGGKRIARTSAICMAAILAAVAQFAPNGLPSIHSAANVYARPALIAAIAALLAEYYRRPRDRRPAMPLFSPLVILLGWSCLQRRIGADLFSWRNCVYALCPALCGAFMISPFVASGNALKKFERRTASSVVASQAATMLVAAVCIAARVPHESIPAAMSVFATSSAVVALCFVNPAQFLGEKARLSMRFAPALLIACLLVYIGALPAVAMLSLSAAFALMERAGRV